MCVTLSTRESGTALALFCYFFSVVGRRSCVPNVPLNFMLGRLRLANAFRGPKIKELISVSLFKRTVRSFVCFFLSFLFFRSFILGSPSALIGSSQNPNAAPPIDGCGDKRAARRAVLHSEGRGEQMRKRRKRRRKRRALPARVAIAGIASSCTDRPEAFQSDLGVKLGVYYFRGRRRRRGVRLEDCGPKERAPFITPGGRRRG